MGTGKETVTLVRHPAPHPTESLMGYMLRLSEVNGYSTMWSLCQLAGLRQSEIRTTGIRIAKLAQVARRQSADLEGIAFTPPDGMPRWARLLNHPLPPAELNILSPRFCPQCVVEKGFIEAHWHLRLMAVCPVHLRHGFSSCRACEKPLRWFRPGLLECECAAQLNDQGGQPLSEQDGGLSAVIRSKVLGSDSVLPNSGCLPLDHLMKMNLRSLLALLRGLGRLRIAASGRADSSDDLTVVLAANEVLRQWPENFMKLMTDFANQSGDEAEAAAAKRFAPIHRVVFRNKAIAPGDQTDFLKTAFVEFLVNRWGRAYVDRKLLRHLSEDSEQRFLSRAEFAAKVGVQQRTAARLLLAKAIPTERVKCGKAERVIVDATGLVPTLRGEGAVVRVRTAAKRLGLPVSVLGALRDSGDFVVRHLPTGRTGWHEYDLEAFERKVIAASISTATGGQVIELSRIMQNRHHTPPMKAEVVRSILVGDLVAWRGDKTGMAALHVKAESFDRWMTDVSNRQLASCRTPVEAARELRCERGCIRSLLKSGHLRGSNTYDGFKIDGQSIVAFQAEYASLVSYARRFNTSTRSLMERCKTAGIDLLFVPLARRAGPQPFIRVSDGAHLLAAAG